MKKVNLENLESEMFAEMATNKVLGGGQTCTGATTSTCEQVGGYTVSDLDGPDGNGFPWGIKVVKKP